MATESDQAKPLDPAGKSTAVEPATPSFKQLVGFGTGSIGMGVWVTVPGLLLLYYLTNIVGVNPFLAGLVRASVRRRAGREVVFEDSPL